MEHDQPWMNMERFSRESEQIKQQGYVFLSKDEKDIMQQVLTQYAKGLGQHGHPEEATEVLLSMMKMISVHDMYEQQLAEDLEAKTEDPNGKG